MSVVTKPVPGRFWYVVAALIAVAGVAGGVYFGVSRIGGLANSLTRIVVPGEHVLKLAEAGTYTIFHEASGTVDGVLYSAADISGLRVRLSAATGEGIPLKRPTASMTYNFGGSSAVGILQFAIAAPGEYRLSAAYDDGRTEPKAILSIASGFFEKLLAAILLVVGLTLGPMLLATGIAVVTFFRRRNAMAGQRLPTASA